MYNLLYAIYDTILEHSLNMISGKYGDETLDMSILDL